MNMRAKFQVSKVEKNDGFESLTFFAVTDSEFGPNGENDDNTYARWTPNGDLKMNITNPALLGKYKVGEKYYLDFTKAEK